MTLQLQSFQGLGGDEVVQLVEVIRRCAYVFSDHPLPAGVVPSRGRMGMEHRDGAFHLLVDRGSTYSGDRASVRQLVQAGALSFDDVHELLTWLEWSLTPATSPDEAPRRDVSELRRELSGALLDEIIDQDSAVTRLAALAARHVSKPSPTRPLVVLAGGPTGTGKSRSAEILAAALDVSEAGPCSMIAVDCAEFEEHHRVASLLGAPPGYAGSGRTPDFLRELDTADRAVVILDEWGREHPDVARTFMGAFGAGRLRPASGGEAIDVSNHIFVLTSNLADEQFVEFVRANEGLDARELESAYRRMLSSAGMGEALVNRLDAVLPFAPLSPAACAALAVASTRRAAAEFDIQLRLVDPLCLIDVVAELDATDPFGARSIERAVVDRLGDLFAEGDASGPVDLMVRKGAPVLVATTDEAAVTTESTGA